MPLAVLLFACFASNASSFGPFSARKKKAGLQKKGGGKPSAFFLGQQVNPPKIRPRILVFYLESTWSFFLKWSDLKFAIWFTPHPPSKHLPNLIGSIGSGIWSLICLGTKDQGPSHQEFHPLQFVARNRKMHHSSWFTIWVFPKNSATPKWMVYKGKPY